MAVSFSVAKGTYENARHIRYVLGRWVRSASCVAMNLLDQVCVDFAVDNGLHHGQMLEIIVCLEQSVTSKEFDKNATYAPYVARE